MRDISKGLLLEDTGDLLAWRSHLEVLRGVSSPEIKERGNTSRVTELIWASRTCLAGLRCTATATFLHAVNSPNLTLTQLDLTSFEIDPEEFEGVKQVTDGHRFDYLTDCLVRRFGPPLDLLADDYYREEVAPGYRLNDIRNACWQIGEVYISHCWGFHDGHDKTLVTALTLIPT